MTKFTPRGRTRKKIDRWQRPYSRGVSGPVSLPGRVSAAAPAEIDLRPDFPVNRRH